MKIKTQGLCVVSFGKADFGDLLLGPLAGGGSAVGIKTRQQNGTAKFATLKRHPSTGADIGLTEVDDSAGFFRLNDRCEFLPSPHPEDIIKLPIPSQRRGLLFILNGRCLLCVDYGRGLPPPAQYVDLDNGDILEPLTEPAVAIQSWSLVMRLPREDAPKEYVKMICEFPPKSSPT
jgi:hypothetical protein